MSHEERLSPDYYRDGRRHNYFGADDYLRRKLEGSGLELGDVYKRQPRTSSSASSRGSRPRSARPARS